MQTGNWRDLTERGPLDVHASAIRFRGGLRARGAAPGWGLAGQIRPTASYACGVRTPREKRARARA